MKVKYLNHAQKQIPINHHFVPVFYQKRFLAKDNDLIVLNKVYMKLSRKSPASICYVKNLHTVYNDGDRDTFLESYYGDIERTISEFLTSFDSLDSQEDIRNLFLMHEVQKSIKIFISIMFWRNPVQNELAKQYSKKIVELYDNSPDEVKQIIFRRNRKRIKKLQKNSNKESVQKLIQYFVLPFVTFKIFDDSNFVDLALVPKDALVSIITCDNPIVRRGALEDLFNYKYFAFPLNSKIVLGDENLHKFSIKRLNLEIASNADKYIMSSDEAMLKSLINDLKSAD